MASLDASGGEVSIRMPSEAANPVCGVLQRKRRSTITKQERRLNSFVLFVASGEWVGNAFGALAFLWATVVLLGGYGKELNDKDFGIAAGIIFIEAFRYPYYMLLCRGGGVSRSCDHLDFHKEFSYIA
ncbi:hypothetical protein GQ55_5G241200 [Panicum hallii var. hallii]|uniref:Uncharacterized protein n=1 Tax=Panicum hallii var. hallii TaxID=1504633 RepID=A0A2T7DJQ8_9POAL|nr:hypothetical protein GQ55_5G241200 [Panicum hallii var. hallii]